MCVITVLMHVTQLLLVSLVSPSLEFLNQDGQTKPFSGHSKPRPLFWIRALAKLKNFLYHSVCGPTYSRDLKTFFFWHVGSGNFLVVWETKGSFLFTLQELARAPQCCQPTKSFVCAGWLCVVYTTTVVSRDDWLSCVETTDEQKGPPPWNRRTHTPLFLIWVSVPFHSLPPSP